MKNCVFVCVWHGKHKKEKIIEQNTTYSLFSDEAILCLPPFPRTEEQIDIKSIEFDKINKNIQRCRWQWQS